MITSHRAEQTETLEGKFKLLVVSITASMTLKL